MGVRDGLAGPRFELTLKSPETFLNERLDEDMAIAEEEFGRARFDDDDDYDDYSGLGQYYGHWRERF